MATQVERIAALEVRVEELTQSVDKLTGHIEDLLMLRNKGAGAFWVVSTIVGSGLLGFAVTIVQWIKG